MVHQRGAVGVHLRAVVSDGEGRRALGVPRGREAGLPQDPGDLLGPGARVLAPDHAAVRQEQRVSQVDVERNPTALGQKSSVV